MSHCIHCNSGLPADAAFCPECGRDQTPVGEGAPMMTLGSLETIGGRATGTTSRSDAPLLEPGARFADRYTIVAPLGAGGMGVVYRAKDDVGEREVALKLIRPERAGSERELQRLVDEGLTARDIRHQSVVAVYDVGLFEGTPYLSMEVVEGMSLRAWMRGRVAAGEDVGVADALSIARDVAEGLRAAHAKGVVHRDLKPENVILETPPDGGGVSLKILDFGIARAGRGTRAESGTGSGLGTPRYMAPEQVTNADLAGPSADVYSLSVMLYELLVGVLPQGHWQPPSTGRSDVPRALDDLVQEGLANRPQARPQSMDDFIARLDAATDGDTLVNAGKRAFADLERARERWRHVVAGRWSPRWTKVALGAGVLVVALGVLDIVGALDPVEPSPAHTERPPQRDPRQDVVPAGWTDPEWEGVDDDIVHDDPEEPESDSPFDDWSVLSGTWQHATGNAFDVRVTRLGRVRGDGSILLNDGFSVGRVPATIRGKIDDGAIDFDLFIDGSVFAKGEGVWIGNGTFSVQYFAPNGLPREADTILVNGGSPR